jgi:hypothetical protein
MGHHRSGRDELRHSPCPGSLTALCSRAWSNPTTSFSERGKHTRTGCGRRSNYVSDDVVCDALEGVDSRQQERMDRRD